MIREFFEDDARSPRHILASGESCEVVDLFELWEPRAAEFPGLAERMRAVVGRGPLLREEENPGASTNRPRNDAFGYLVAASSWPSAFRWLLSTASPLAMRLARPRRTSRFDGMLALRYRMQASAIRYGSWSANGGGEGSD